MPTANDTVRFNTGDDIVQSFVLRDDDDNVLDITGLSMRAEVWWSNRKQFDLTAGAIPAPIDHDMAVIEIVENDPGTAADPEDQLPHGFIGIGSNRLDDEMPAGRVAYIKTIFTDSNGQVSSSEALWIEKVLP